MILPSGDQSWLVEKTLTVYALGNWRISNCYIWLPEGMYIYIYTYSQYSHPEVESIWNFQYILTKWAYLWSLNIPYSILFQDDYVHIVFYVLYNIIHVSNTYIYVMYINVYWYIYILYAYRCTLNHPPKRGLWNWVCLYFITGMMHILALIFWLPRCLMAWNVPVLDRTAATCTKVKT
jgi:hypothetical protein